ncbi:MAG: hypothetical protein AAGI91_04920 [Bacteroidota bacterium]
MGAQPLRFTLAHDATPTPPDLPDKRHDQIQERLDSGFYQRPDVLLETAERLYADLMEGEPLDEIVHAEARDQPTGYTPQTELSSRLQKRVL